MTRHVSNFGPQTGSPFRSFLRCSNHQKSGTIKDQMGSDVQFALHAREGRIMSNKVLPGMKVAKKGAAPGTPFDKIQK